MELTLTNSDKKAIIDDKNWVRVSKYSWYLKQVNPRAFYVATSVRQDGKNRTVYLHRFITDAGLGIDVHHKDHDPLNNLEENLEERPAPEHRCWHLANI
jgi:hypothetical protein